MVIDTEELKSFINIWVIAISSISYCYFISSRIAPGVPRLLSLLPVITLFFILPLPISTAHLAFPTFFYLVWLANFKLSLFAFNRGPLSSKSPLPLPHFIAFALLPINPKQFHNKVPNPYPFSLLQPILLPLKAIILITIVHTYQYKDNLPSSVLMILYISHMYLAFELSLAFTAFIVKLFIGFGQFEAQYNEPYLATSVQDFWGRRWNLVTSIVLRDTVYNPVRAMCNKSTLSKLHVQMVAIFVTFVVSGIMHELMFYYVMRVKPTWEVTWFFVLHGAYTAIEVFVKDKAKGKFKLHGIVSGLLTLVFMFVTASWLFMVQPLRNGLDAKVIKESSILLKLF